MQPTRLLLLHRSPTCSVNSPRSGSPTVNYLDTCVPPRYPKTAVLQLADGTGVSQIKSRTADRGGPPAWVLGSEQQHIVECGAVCQLAHKCLLV